MLMVFVLSLQNISVYASIEVGNSAFDELGILRYIEEFSVLEEGYERIVLMAREGYTTVTLVYDRANNFVSILSEEADDGDGFARAGMPVAYVTGLRLDLELENLTVIHPLEYRGGIFDISEEVPVRIGGYGGTERVAIPIGVIIGQALLNFLIRALLTITIGGIIFANATNVHADLSRQTQHNHFMAALRGGQLFIGSGINLSMAQTRLRARQDVWSRSDGLAWQAANTGGGFPEGPENHWRTGRRTNLYYDHWHIPHRAGGHSFWGGGRAGAN